MLKGRKRSVISSVWFLLSATFVFGLVFAATVLFSKQNAEVLPTYAESGSNAISITSSPSLNLVLDLDVSPKIASIKDTLSITTTATRGYKLYLSTNNNTVNGNRLVKDGDFSSKYFLTPSNGTIALPLPLDNKQWGFAIANNTAGISTNGFDNSYSSITNASKFAAVPNKDNQVLIQTTSSASPTTSPTTLDIYYALKANLNLPGGSYKNAIVYTAIANPEHTTFGGITTMQEMTADICNNETTPHAFLNGASSGEILSQTTRIHTTDKNFVPEAELTDTRDGKKYVIRKLADGNCWMVKNLDLGDTAVELTPENTDLNGVPGFTLGPAETASSSWGAYDKASDVNQIRLHNDGNKWFTNISLGAQESITSSEPSDPELKLKHIGNYYNWYTATAKTGTYEMNSNQEAFSSICPKGWRLPVNTGPKSYLNLTQTVYNLTINISSGEGPNSSLKLRSKPFSFPLSGNRDYYSGSAINQGSDGFFWSSTAASTTSSLTLGLHYPYLRPQNSNFKAYGFSIRCLARGKPTFDGVTKMQEMTHDICNNETTPHAFVDNNSSNPILSVTTRTHTTDKSFIPEAELIDTRDNKKYTIRKLADGNCWMVKNLDLGNAGESLTLTSEDSDVATSFTLNNIGNPGASWSTGNSSDQVAVIDDGNKWLINVSQGRHEGIAYIEPSDPELKLRHIGNYYNWYTATAGSGTYSMSSGNASYSICPKGWRLPFGEETSIDKGFRKLTNKYNITNGYNYGDEASSYKFRSKPFSFPLSGGYWSNSVSGRSSVGNFWSSTVKSYNRAYILQQSFNGLTPEYDVNKVAGNTIRCVAR